jgi:hypothetical protein
MESAMPTDGNQYSSAPEAPKQPQQTSGGHFHYVKPGEHVLLAGTSTIQANAGRADQAVMAHIAQVEAEVTQLLAMTQIIKSAIAKVEESKTVVPPPPPLPSAETHWMVAAGFPPFDPSHHYTKQELNNLARTFCALHSTQGMPMGGDTARRKYRKANLLPRIPGDRWPMQRGRGGAPRKG